jgi:hypothetical protein
MKTVAKPLCAVALMAGLAMGAVERPKQRHPAAQQYRRRVLNKSAVPHAAASAAIGQVRNAPHQWGRGASGFAKRFGSSLGQHVAKGTIEFGVAAAHHENLHYQRSNLQGKWPRVKYAVKSTFIVPRTKGRRGKTVALGRISGNMGAGMLSRAWMPAATVGGGVASGGIGLGADVGANVAREFWPQKKKKERASR